MTAGSRANPESKLSSGEINPVGRQNGAIRARDVRAADLEKGPTKPVEDRADSSS